ncbi:MAG TPA: oligosaccharide flippase family protein, partial [Candidatus Faecimonas intestinavium]|nr:oligosaccharide flippase family protein [Candidatus Faecimonas intestinavium]
MKEEEKSLVKNTVIILISKFCTQFLSFFILPILTSILTPKEYGTFDLITTYSWLLVPFLSMQLENGIFRYLIDFRKQKAKQSEIISSGIAAGLIQVLLVSVIFIILNYVFDIDNAKYIYIISLSTIILNFPLQISRGFGDNITYAISSIFVGVINIIICAFTVWYLRLGIFGMVIATVIANVIGGLYAILKLKLYYYIKIKNISKNKVVALSKYSFPLVPNSISSWIISISDKVMISLYLGAAANGIYSIATKFSILLSHFYSVFNLSWTESASVNVNSNRKEDFFSNSINTIFKFCSCICLIVLALMPVIFKIMINKTYNQAYQYIPLLILGSIFEILAGLLSAVYISLKFSKNIAISTLVTGLINIIINLFFLKHGGIWVACLSTLISYILLSLYRIIDLKKYLNLQIDYKYIIILLTMYSISTYFYHFNSIIIS